MMYDNIIAIYGRIVQYTLTTMERNTGENTPKNTEMLQLSPHIGMMAKDIKAHRRIAW